MKPASRFPIEFPLVLCTKNGARSKFSGRTMNLSSSGIGVECDRGEDAVNVGEKINVKLILDREKHAGSELLFQGQVIWKSDGQIGLKIIRMGRTSQRTFHHLIHGYQTLFELSNLGFAA